MTAFIAMLVAANTYVGVGTQYLPDAHAGNPLYCDRDGTLIYDEATVPWVAMPIETFRDGRVECGDLIHVRSLSGLWPSFTARAYDAGDLGSRTFRGGLPVVVDVPPWVATWDTPVPKVRVTNITAIARECKQRGWCD